jgi:hypothetical protein
LPLQESLVVSPLLSQESLVVSPLLLSQELLVESPLPLSQELLVESPLPLSQESSPLSLVLAHASPLLSVLPLLAQPSAQALHTSTAVGPDGSGGWGVSVGIITAPASAE